MWKIQLILILCSLYNGESLAKAISPRDFGYDYKVEGFTHLPNKGKAITTTQRPLLQQYWHNFVRNLPTLPPLPWNITNPIGNLFNAGTQQIHGSPALQQHYMMERPVKRKIKNFNKHRPSLQNSKRRKVLQSRNNYNTLYNTHDNSYQQTAQLQLQPLGLDYNGVMHFYDQYSGQYYALQLEAQPYYYSNSRYGQDSHQYILPHNYHNGGSNSDDESYYQHNYEPEYIYNSDHEYTPWQGEYDEANASDDEDSMEYDDGVELADDWGYNDEEIFADRKLKGELNNFDTIAAGIVKIHKQLLTPESEEDVKRLLAKGQMLTDNIENNLTEKEPEITTASPEIESARNALATNTRIQKDGAANKKTKRQRIVEIPKKSVKYFILPANFWIQNRKHFSDV